MTNIKFKISIIVIAFIIIFYIMCQCRFCVNLDFNYVYKSNNEKIVDDMYPVWTLLSTEEELKQFEIAEHKTLNFEKHNYIACQGGSIVKIKCNIKDYLFNDKKRAYVFVNETNPNDVYVYKIRKINLIHDLMSAPTTILK